MLFFFADNGKGLGVLIPSSELTVELSSSQFWLRVELETGPGGSRPGVVFRSKTLFLAESLVFELLSKGVQIWRIPRDIAVQKDKRFVGLVMVF